MMICDPAQEGHHEIQKATYLTVISRSRKTADPRVAEILKAFAAGVDSAEWRDYIALQEKDPQYKAWEAKDDEETTMKAEYEENSKKFLGQIAVFSASESLKLPGKPSKSQK